MMSVRKITEFYQMRRNNKREENGIKRRLTDGDSQEESNTAEPVGTTGDVKRNCRRRALVESSPLTQPQKEIFWNTVSPECASRLQPRAMNESQIHEDVVTTIKSYVLDAKSNPKPAECGLLDSWLNRSATETTQPPTPKSLHTNWQNQSRIAKPKPSMSAIKLFLENANVDNKSEQSTSRALPAESSDIPVDKCPDFDDVWEEEELFNDTDFLEATQQLETKYKEAKVTSPVKPPPTVTASTSKIVKSENVDNLGQSSSTVVDPVGQTACKKTIVRETGRSSSSSCVDARIPQIADNVSKSVSKEESQAEIAIRKATVIKEVVLDDVSQDNDDDDEIDRIMCTLECPSNSLLDIQNAPTQVIHHSGSDLPLPSSTENVANNSFVFDSDDSFGADFDV